MTRELGQLLEEYLDGTDRLDVQDALRKHVAAHPEDVAEILEYIRDASCLRLIFKPTHQALPTMVRNTLEYGKTGASFAASVSDAIAKAGNSAGQKAGRQRLYFRSQFKLLAVAASVAIVAGGVWLSLRQAGVSEPLGLRVAEASGEWSVVRLRPLDFARGYGGQVSGQWSVGGGENIQHPSGTKAVVGMELKQGDRVVVKDGGKVGLKYEGEETKIELMAVTEAAFGSEKGGKRVRLDGGTLVCSAAVQREALEIGTVHGVARVVGTRFALSADTRETRLVVVNGQVDLLRGAQLTAVREGNTAVASEQGVTLFRSPEGPLAAAGRNPEVGVNVCGWSGAGGDYTAEKIWADAMRSQRQWGKPFAVNELVALDTNGWPTVDASCLVYHGLLTGNNHGAYRLSFDCNNPGGVTIAEDWGGGTVQGRTNSGNRVSCRLVISDTNNSACLLRFQNTSGGVRNVKLMRPVVAGSTNSYGEEVVFTTPVLQAVAPFRVLRYMHWMHVDRPLSDMEWSRRTRWSRAAQRGVNPYGWGYSGPSWESVIKFANASGKDAWICLPVRANDDYIRNLALLFRDGGADCAPLRPGLKLYLEYGNEIWNSGTFATQWAWVTNAAATVAALRYDGTSDPFTLVYRYHGMRTLQISGIFREVFGSEAMMTRIRPVLCLQQDNVEGCNRTMTFLDRYYAKRDPRSDWLDPHPVNHYLYALGCSAYFTPGDVPPALTLDGIWTSGGFAPDNYYDTFKSLAAIARGYGLAFVSCASGPQPAYQGDETITRQAAVDSRMRAKQAELCRVLGQLDAELDVWYTLAEKNLTATPQSVDGHSGLIRGDIANPRFPRYQAVLDMSSTPPAPARFGSLAPFTRAGSDFDMDTLRGLAVASTGGVALSSQGQVYAASYCFRVPVSGAYVIGATCSSKSRASIVVECDGREVATWRLEGPDDVSSARVTSPIWMACDVPRVHAVRLIATEGEVRIETVTVEGGGKDLTRSP